MKNCLNCYWSRFPPNSLNNGKRSVVGDCKIKVSVPHCYTNYKGDLPQKRKVSKFTPKDCPYWKERE